MFVIALEVYYFNFYHQLGSASKYENNNRTALRGTEKATGNTAGPGIYCDGANSTGKQCYSTVEDYSWWKGRQSEAAGTRTIAAEASGKCDVYKFGVITFLRPDKESAVFI